MNKLAMAAVAALGLTLAGCDSAAENEIEKTADAIDESYNAEADMIESIEAGGPSEAAAEQQADALRAEGEAVAKELKQGADELDRAPN